MSRARALRATAVALALLLALAFAAANFVLVDVHLFVIGFETRLAWAVVVPVGLAFGAGVLWGRAGPADRPADAGDEGRRR